MSDNTGKVPAQRSETSSTSTGSRKASGWQPQTDGQGRLVLSRPVAPNRGRPNAFASDLLRYIEKLEHEVETLREQVDQLPDSTQADRISELEAELASMRTQLEEATKALTVQARQAEEQVARLTVQLKMRDHLQVVMDGLSKALKAPVQLTRSDTGYKTLIREYIVGNLKFYHTVKEAFPDELIVTGAHANVKLQPYYIREFRSNGMPDSEKLLYILFLATAATLMGLDDNRERLDESTFKVIYDMPFRAPSTSRPTGIRGSLPRLLGETVVRATASDSFDPDELTMGAEDYAIDFSQLAGANTASPEAVHTNKCSVWPDSDPTCRHFSHKESHS